MKNLFILLVIFVLTDNIIAQPPQTMSYQCVIRNNAGALLANQTVGLRNSILQGSATGTVIFQETYNPKPLTNANGLISIEIGSGVSSIGTFSSINWSTGIYYLRTETDPSGGTNYTINGTNQLLSVPYSMYSAKAGNGLNLNSNPISGDILFYNGTNWQLLSKGVNGQTLRLDNGFPGWGEPGYALPLVTTNPVTNILLTTGTSGGNVIATGFSNITDRGVCWSTNQNPTLTDSKTSDGSGIGTFGSTLTSLLPNTTYYVRAYATNGAGTAFGNQISFTTFQNVVFPTVTTAAISNITANSALSGGNVTATGGAEVTQRGVCWSSNQDPTIADSKTSDGPGTGLYQSQITALSPGIYYARAYATNSSGTGYGNLVTITTNKTLPVLTTKNITGISALGAVSGGNITTTGGGTISARGICWGESPNPAITDNTTTSTSITASYSAALTSAAPGTTYYLRAYATNEIGTGYGDQKTFTTSDAAYYTSFESGLTPAGWTGQFTVSNETAFDGSYSFMSLNGIDCDAILTITLANDGQLSFYYFLTYNNSLTISIDDVAIANYPYDFLPIWKQSLISITAGTHKIQWHWDAYQGGNKCYLDQITITK